MTPSEREKRDRGAWYTCLDPKLGLLRDAAREACFQHNTTAPVRIGGGAIVLPGVQIGDAAIVGAGAVMTRDVDAGARVSGNPAVVIRPSGVPAEN